MGGHGDGGLSTWTCMMGCQVQKQALLKNLEKLKMLEAAVHLPINSEQLDSFQRHEGR